jgi:hypothetical protein
MVKIIPAERLSRLLDLAERLTVALDRGEDPAKRSELLDDARSAFGGLEAWGEIEERSSQAEQYIQYLAEAAKDLLAVAEGLENVLDINIPQATTLDGALRAISGAFPPTSERQDTGESAFRGSPEPTPLEKLVRAARRARELLASLEVDMSVELVETAELYEALRPFEDREEAQERGNDGVID